MYDQINTIKEMQKCLDRNYEQVKENQRLSSKPYYSFGPKHTNLQNEITGAYYEEKYTWKDYLYIVPPILLLVYIIIRSIL